ncbi:hypothetical protein ACFRAR_10280 [Kitasatospora sp. NPDC056651]
MTELGEILLRHAQQDAGPHGEWTREPGGDQERAVVAVTYDPDA